LQEVLKGITALFKRLHVCWDKALEGQQGAEGLASVEALIPYKDEGGQWQTRDAVAELEAKRGESYRVALEDHSEVAQQLTMRNRQLKEIIDQLRKIVWEINTMLAHGGPDKNNAPQMIYP